MKEIKFKAYFVDSKDKVQRIDTITLSTSPAGYLFTQGRSDGFSLKAIVQCTGLKSTSVSGMSIQDAYFGDVIRFCNTEGRIIEAELIWYELEHCIGFKRLSDGVVYTQRYFNDSGYFQPSIIQFEIIGNIYETPELG